MTGRELYDYLVAHNMENAHIFIETGGMVSPVESLIPTESGDVVLGDADANRNDYRSGLANRKRYFSEWFDIISKSTAKMLYRRNPGALIVLRTDGTDCYADNYSCWKDIPDDALFGVKKGTTVAVFWNKHRDI